MQEYEKAVAYEPDHLELMQEIHTLHKQLSELDAVVDSLFSKLEHVLVPDAPRPAPDEMAQIKMRKSPLREELQVTQNRMRTQIERLGNLHHRIDL